MLPLTAGKEGQLSQHQARRHVHGVHLRLDDHQHCQLERYATAGRLTMTAALRLLVERALAAELGRPGDQVSAAILAQLRSLNRAAIGAMVAAEHSRLAIESIIPRDFRRPQWAVEAATAARRRLDELELAEADL